jgi:predicted  nucleic acid-binding Zn-ribbon protein
MNKVTRKQLETMADKLGEFFANQVQPLLDELTELADLEQEKADNMADGNLAETDLANRLLESAENLQEAVDTLQGLEIEIDTAVEAINRALES